MSTARADLMKLIAGLGDKGKAVYKAADEGIDQAARGVQKDLLSYLNPESAPLPEGIQRTATRMAASPAALMALKAVPAVGLGAGLFMGGEDETFANQAMDILGVGAGIYGVNRGVGRLGGTTPAGAAMRLGALGVGALGGNIGIDVLQSAL